MADGIIQGEGFTIKESKFGYFFGRVISTPNNIQRSLQNLRELRRLGIDEERGGREKLLQIFQEGLNSPEIQILICYFYPNHNLNCIPQVTSIVPKIYN